MLFTIRIDTLGIWDDSRELQLRPHLEFYKNSVDFSWLFLWVWVKYERMKCEEGQE